MSTPPALVAQPEPPLVVRHDFRLVPVALTAWLGALLGLLWGWVAAVGCGVAAAVVAVVLFRWSRSARPWWRAGAVALIVCGLVVAVPVAVRLAQAHHDSLRGAAERGARAALHATVSERPRPLESAGYAGQQAGVRSVLITAEVAEVVVDGHRVDSTGRVVLIAPAAAWSGLLPGQRVGATGSLAPARGGEMTVAVVYVRGPPADAGPAPWWQRAADSMRTALRRACAVLPAEPAGLLPGLVVGDTSALPPRVDREFTDAGMSHLTAVSGSNLMIICGAVLLLLRMFRLGPRFSAVAAGMALLGFVVLAGPEPSVLRAGVMAGVGLLAMALGRKGSAVPALSAAVCLLVVWDPAMALSFGFALSVVATAGLVLLAPRWAEAMIRRGVPAGFAEGIAVPLAAFVVTAPVIAGMAGQVSVVSVFANILAAPVVVPATILGVLATVTAGWWPSMAEVLVRGAGPEAEWLITVARHASGVPGAVVPWPGGWWGGLLAAVVAVVLLAALSRRRLRIALAVAVVCVVLVLIPVRVVAPPWPPAGWSAVACDVGQGDGLVLSAGEPGRAVVVDTGPEPGPVDRCLDRLGIERVPLIVLSHLHADHIGGLDSVFEGRAVGGVAVGPGRSPPWAWRQVAEVAARRGVPLLEFAVGQRMDWPGLALEVLGPRYVPSRPRDERDGTGINNTSVVLRASGAAGRLLLTGDVELAAQADLLAGGVDLRADVLKVPHHGSRYSLPRFLDAVGARLAVVSVGAGNTYGHPNQGTLDTLRAVGALITRTDTDGDTAIVPDARGPSIVRRGRARGPPRSRRSIVQPRLRKKPAFASVSLFQTTPRFALPTCTPYSRCPVGTSVTVNQ
ncbi:ComEC/Rec2 family competence protein [Amycolatopsis anabasis]|uniref:ComEC/Rec2 family competence protein n=1 Tax=Amycolatopsis anabasis TaxID=1840409 RepID=UPI00131E1C85|nr:ComEC/Rec2 family competence protein [Amycolatopsis anabasis]